MALALCIARVIFPQGIHPNNNSNLLAKQPACFHVQKHQNFRAQQWRRRDWLLPIFPRCCWNGRILRRESKV